MKVSISQNMSPALTIAFILFATPLFSQEQIDVYVNTGKRYQTIENFGASACWYGEPIGKNWPQPKKEKIAEYLFSMDTLADGSPKGIGLTSWRFNIGAGTAEQGDSSGIPDIHHRVECFLDKNGNYDWTKQSGYQWFLRKASEYHVPDLIAFVNSPPVFYTKNGLGYKLSGGHNTNLASDRYEDFSAFLATVLNHFDQQGLHFNYVSPVNEPQWEWKSEYGEAKQEGSPYTNEEIFHLINSFNKEISKNHLTTKILIPEAGMLNYLTDEKGVSSNQIKEFWDPQSPQYLGNKENLAPITAGHSYFTDLGNDAPIKLRQEVHSKTSTYNIKFWQTEYCLLGNGYKEELQSRTSFDCGLFLAKMIHYDLTEGNASAWQYWNSFEPGDWKRDTRYYLIALQPNSDFSDGEFHRTGNYCALGHFSRFVRPSMQRIDIASDKNDPNLIMSAFEDPKTGQVVIVIINYSTQDYSIVLHAPKQSFKIFESNEQEQLKCKGKFRSDKITLHGRSIYTLVSN